MNLFQQQNTEFEKRHIGTLGAEKNQMLKTIGV
jgi:hypothetical protein